MREPNILLVDETKLSKTVSDALMRFYKCKVKTTNSCTNAIKILKAQDVDLLIQDDFCPEKVNGLAVVDFVLKEKKNIEIIFKSCGDQFIEKAIKELDKEKRVIILKSFGIIVLFKAIEEILDKKGGFDYKIKRTHQTAEHKFKYTRSEILGLMRPILVEAIKSPRIAIQDAIEKTMPWAEYQEMVNEVGKYFEIDRLSFSKEVAKRIKSKALKK